VGGNPSQGVKAKRILSAT